MFPRRRRVPRAGIRPVVGNFPREPA